jgi:hypothetical protein
MGQMLCHGAGDLPPEQAREVICQGWVRVLGLDAIGVRDRGDARRRHGRGARGYDRA